MSSTKLSILVPTINGREAYLERLLEQLENQVENFNVDKEVEILVLKDNRELSIGEKRNRLIDLASGEYLAYVDDDDGVSDNYIEWQMKVANSGLDCGSLVGMYYENGRQQKTFIHSIAYDRAWEDKDRYYRAPNHLNCIRRQLIIDAGIRYQHKNFGEDGCFMEDLIKQGVLKTEFPVTECIYNYYFRTKQDGI